MQKAKEVERENGRKKQREEDGGEWIYNAEYDHYDWVGEGPPKVHNDDPEYVPLTAEELKNINQQREEWLLADMEEQRKQAQEKRRIKQEQIKVAMETPIAAFPVKEKCEYEKLRDKIISERMQAMQEAGFFDDLNDYKQKIGMI